MADIETRNQPPIGLDDLERDSQSGWNRFMRFTVITVISLIIIILLIAAFTVWS